MCVWLRKNTVQCYISHGSGATNSPPVVSFFFSMAMEEQFLDIVTAHSKLGGARGRSPDTNQEYRSESRSR